MEPLGPTPVPKIGYEGSYNPTNPAGRAIIDGANAYAENMLAREEAERALAERRIVDYTTFITDHPDATELGPSGFYVEGLPTDEAIPAVSGLRGFIRERRIKKAIRETREAIHDVDVSHVMIDRLRNDDHDEISGLPRGRAGWPGIHKPSVDLINPLSGKPEKGPDGKPVKVPNKYRPTKRGQDRKILRADRLVNRRSRAGMFRNSMTKTHGERPKPREIGPDEPYLGPRDPRTPKSNAEELHDVKIDIKVAHRDLKVKYHNWRLDRMQQAPHARARAERAAGRARRLTEKQEEAAAKQESRREVSREMRSWRKYNRTERS